MPASSSANATGFDQVADSLYEVAPQMVSVERPTTAGAYRGRLETGETGSQRLLVVSDLTGMSTAEPCARCTEPGRG